MCVRERGEKKEKKGGKVREGYSSRSIIDTRSALRMHESFFHSLE